MMVAGLDDPRDYVDDVFGNLDALSPKRQRDMRMLLGFARRVDEASSTKLCSLAGLARRVSGGVRGDYRSRLRVRTTRHGARCSPVGQGSSLQLVE